MLPTFYTKRLIIRPINIRDAKDMYEYATDPRVGPYAGWEPHRSIEETKQIINMMTGYKTRIGSETFAIVERKSFKMIGTIELYNLIPDFKAELGYSLNPNYWNLGYTTEAAFKILEHGFLKLNLKRIEAGTFIDNIASQKVCEHLGMKYEGTQRNGYMRYDNRLFDKMVFGITDKEFFEHLRKVEESEERS